MTKKAPPIECTEEEISAILDAAHDNARSKPVSPGKMAEKRRKNPDVAAAADGLFKLFGRKKSE